MAKITFETQMKGAETITRELEKLSKNITDLGLAGAKVGDQLDKTFKNLSNSIEQVHKGQGGLAALVRSFTDVGHAINHNLGNAQVGLIKRLKDEIVEAKKELGSLQTQAQDATLSDAERAGAAVQADALQRRIMSMQMKAFMDSPFAMPFGGRFGALTVGGLMSGVPMVGAGLAGIGQAASMYNQFSVMDPIRNRMIMREFQYAPGAAAMRGDITGMALRQYGVGAEQAMLRDPDLADRLQAGLGTKAGWAGLGTGLMAGATSINYMAGRLLQGLTGGAMGGGLIQTFQYWKGRQQEYQDAALAQVAMERRKASEEEYRQLIDPASQIVRQRSQAVDLYERSFGLQTSTAIMNQLAAGGVSTQMAAPMVNLMARFGVAGGASADFVRAYRTLGVGQRGMEQMAREAALGGGGIFAQTMALRHAENVIAQAGLGGVGQVAARELLTDIAGSEAARLGRLGRIEDVGRAYGAMTYGITQQTGIPGVDAVRAAQGVGETLKQMQESPTNLMGMMFRSTLSSMGINDPRAWAYFSKMGFQNEATRTKIIEQLELQRGRKLTDKERQDVMSRLSEVGNEYTESYKKMWGGGPVISEVEAFDITGDVTTATNAGDIGKRINEFFDSKRKGAGAVDAQQKIVKARGGLDIQDENLARYEQKAIEAISQAFGKTESQIARGVYDAIGQGFQNISDKMSELSQQFGGERRAVGTPTVTPVESTRQNPMANPGSKGDKGR